MKSNIKINKAPKKAIDEIERINKSMRGDDSVRVGLPKNSLPYPDGTSVVEVGVQNEFGEPSKRIPQRSFLRSTLNENKRKYLTMFSKLSKLIVDGKETKDRALRKVGLQVQTNVRQKITDIKEPPLKVRKGGNPLVDTGHLRQSINFQIGDD